MEYRAFNFRIIYVFRINDEAHKDCLKIGETSGDDTIYFGIEPNSPELNKLADERIREYTQTAAIKYDLLHTELAAYKEGGSICSFNDKKVHDVLKRSKIARKDFEGINAREWFVTDLGTVKQAIKAIREGRESLSASDITTGNSPIVFRPEQEEAIEKTVKHFEDPKNKRMLWNAKMRFGKTLSALEVVKRMGFTRSLILTHRPVVDEGWFKDFGKIFYDNHEFTYGSRNRGERYPSLEKHAIAGNCKYVYFASMQDLRGSEQVGGNFNKNDKIFSTAWDLLIVDEAHEGTQTDLGKAVVNELIKENTKVLNLSGTPFNLLSGYREDEIYTWDYVMEQQMKMEWDKFHLGEPNPYSPLPKLNIYTYDLGKLFTKFADEEVAFNFREFFRVDAEGSFVHQADVNSFLDLLINENKEEDSCYPFATERFRTVFRHTLWMVPGVREAKALSALLKEHSVFQYFKIVNVAGDGDADEENKDAKKKVDNAIGSNPDQTRTITLSCGRLTTGVSVPAWTAVLMLSGSYNTSISSYMQTIFRVQTPATIGGQIKEDCYVFDFAPDRTLKVIAETAKVSKSKTNDNDRKIIGDFLNFCPVISIDGSRMDEFDVPRMLEQLKKVYIERVVTNGFDDSSLYNANLLKLNNLELKNFKDLEKIIGRTKAMPKTKQIEMNNQGLTEEQHEQTGEGRKKRKLTEEEKKALKEKKEKQRQREAAISILRGISIRMPLLVYGAEINDETEEITIENFADLIDQKSWEEFMPKGVTKQKFNSFKKYYDSDVFRAAGKRIRLMVRAADKVCLKERIERITNLFNSFRNPDKETVLTPWRVVNMHIGDCLGGYNFFEEGYKQSLKDPRFIDQGEVTKTVFSPDSRILEINSKTGLYPLYMAYSIYRVRLNQTTSPDKGSKPLFDEFAEQESLSLPLDYDPDLSVETEQRIWDQVISNNLFVICKTPMARSITKRTLVGFRNVVVNAKYDKNLINQLKDKHGSFAEKVKKGKQYWKVTEKDMKFTAIVGNPPYQLSDGGGNGASAKPIYHLFVQGAKELDPPYITMITPSRWFTGGKGLDDYREEMLQDNHLRVIHDFPVATDCFTGVQIKGGVSYFLWKRDDPGDCEVFSHSGDDVSGPVSRPLLEPGCDTFIRYNEAISIVRKVMVVKASSMEDLVKPRMPFGLTNKFRGTKTRKSPSDLKVYISGNETDVKGTVAYVSPSNVTKGTNLIPAKKVFIAKAGSGSDSFPHSILSKPFYGEPGTVCNESYLVIGPFGNKKECENVMSYIATKFFRFLVLLKKNSQNAAKGVYQLVPQQDFSESWTDKKLYNKYNLSEDEIAFIEKMIKPMSLKENI